jgi:two-component system, NarL family, invasion response regulator UvrY
MLFMQNFGGCAGIVSEIGAQLKQAPNTVSTDRARILEKTRTRNDVALALCAQRHSRSAPER